MRIGMITVLIACITAENFSQPSLRRVPQRYTSIQSAVNAAKPGDTVLVEEGLYYENIRINKNIVLASRFILDHNSLHIEKTIIDGSRPRDPLNASVVMIQRNTDTTAVVLGFTLRGGTGSHRVFPNIPLGPNWIVGGGIYVENAGARISHNIITNNVLLTKSSFDNVAGGGIAAADTTRGKVIPHHLLVEYNRVEGNSCMGAYAHGGGLEIGQPGVIRHNVFLGNQVRSRLRSHGGGINMTIHANYDIVADGNYISRNAAGIGGGIRVFSGYVWRGRGIVTNSIISENDSREVGGGVHVAEWAYAIILSNTIVKNRAHSAGGGVNVMDGSEAVLVNNIIWHNKSDQVSMRGIVQASSNLIEDGFRGKDNFSSDPAFLIDDSLYRLSPASPCLGTGLPLLRRANEIFPLPQQDFAGTPRCVPAGSAPDLGAIESPMGMGEASERLSERRRASSDASAKVSFIIQQVSPAERDVETQEMVRAGRMSTNILFNDSLPAQYQGPSERLDITLPPGRNLLEVEVVGRARDTIHGLNVFVSLEGLDPHVSVLYKNRKSLYHFYADLRPGPYQLVVQPQDDENFIDYTNKVNISVVVLSYWYQRWWAYALYGLGVFAVVAGLLLVRVRRLRLEDQVRMNQLEAEKLAEIDRLKSRFFANLSHEFRTPLSMILGPADQLESTEREPGRKEQIRLIRRNAERLLRMVNLLLQFARIESKTIKLSVSLQSIPILLRRIVSSFSTFAVKKGISLKVDIAPVSFEGYVDTEKIEHIVENLISNAIKYTNAGGRVELTARREGTNLVVTVSDTGIGIPAEHLPHIFDRFFRIDPSHQSEGTGIGLSLTKELVELHQGTIAVSSTVGEGTRVTVCLPISGYPEEVAVYRQKTQEVSPKEAFPEPQPVTTLPSPESFEKQMVLIVEDNEDARSYLRSRLVAEFEVAEASTGAEAVERARERVPDVVVSDVMMPEMNGYELCRLLKSDIRTSHIPVILLTALADQTDKIEGLQTGADDYVVKPYDVQELRVRIRNLLANRKIMQDRFTKSLPWKPVEAESKSLDEVFLRKAFSIVAEHVGDQQFDVEQFASEVFLGRAQLHRKLKALTNLAPTDFIRHIRLQRAKELLEKKAGTVAEIADSIGFSNHSYFAKCFQEQFGCLPSELLQRRPL